MNCRASGSSVGVILVAGLTILLAGTVLVSGQAFVQEVDQSREQVDEVLDRTHEQSAADKTPTPTPTDRCDGDENSDERGQGEICETAPENASNTTNDASGGQ